ncbi:MAG: xylulokinase [Phycisphaerales bacterium]
MLLGIDIGTSSAKGLLLDPDGRLVAVTSREYPIARPRPGWSEQDPAAWWDATVLVVRELLARAGIKAGEIRGIGLSGQMHGSVFLDDAALERAGSARIDAIRPALLWNDQRTAPQCESIERILGGRRATIRAVGNAALPGFTLPKLLWLRDHEPDAYARVAKLVNPKDFINLNLTGIPTTDVGDASGTLLFDPTKRAWALAALDTFGIDPDLLPTVLESGVVVGGLTSWAANELGLCAGTPVVAGSGDNQCGAIGAGVVEPGMIGATLGTSGVIYAHADEPRVDMPSSDGADLPPPGRVHTMCAAAGERSWCNTGCMLAAAGALQWARDTLAPDTGFDELMGEAAGVPVGAEGLVFMPHLSGERCPYPDPQARACWIGLSTRHTRAHMIRAVLEGVAFTMARILDIMRSLPVPVNHIRIGGGGAKSHLWKQMHADVFGAPVSTPGTEEGPSFGAALLAGVGAGVWTCVEEACDTTISIRETIDPSPDARRYQPLRAVHDGLYDQLKGTFRALDEGATPPTP